MASIEPGGLDSGDEELTSIGSWTGIGHGQKTFLGVLELEVLVLKLSSIDTLSTSAISSGEVTTLTHELRDDAVEFAALVVKGLA